MRFKTWHLTFWAVYIMLNVLLNIAFAGPTDLEYAPLLRLARFVFAEVVVLLPGLTAAYLFIYWLVSTYFSTKKYLQFFLVTLITLLPLIFLNRVLTYYVVYPVLYDEFPPYSLIGAERLLYAFLDILTPIGLFSTVELLLSRQAEKQRSVQLEKEKLQSELLFLRSQTNPHFLFNTLNNIYVLARKQSEQTAPIIMKLSKLLRYMLYECNTPTVPIQKEIQVIKDYIALEALRYNERLKVDLDIELEDPDSPIAPLLLIPFVENAFKHGASESRFNIQIDIKIIQKEEKLFFSIKNNKADAPPTNELGIGLKNIKRQLALIYPNRHELRIADDAGFYQVDLHLQSPYISNPI